MRHIFLSDICFKRRCSFIFTKYQSAYNSDKISVVTVREEKNMKKDFVKTIAKAFVATALTLSYIPMNSVHAIETSNIKISAVSV